jgi:hypothetical protein
MNQECDDMTITITPKNPDTRWVTLDDNNNIITEGKTPKEAVDLAKKITDNYTVMFVPVKGNTYIF